MFCVDFGFFFFKQKTAYEMRISDWSSDVCSSDLVPASSVRDFRRVANVDAQPVGERTTHGVTLQLRGTVGAVDLYSISSYAQAHKVYFADKIGRASCRERVCQSV